MSTTPEDSLPIQAGSTPITGPEPNSTPSTPPSRRLQVFTTAELAAKPSTLHEVVERVNDAYRSSEMFRDDTRFDTDAEMVDQLTADGACAVLFELREDGAEMIVAVAAAKPYRLPDSTGWERGVMEGDGWRIDEGPEVPAYELFGVASVNLPHCRKQGLAQQCHDALAAYLKEKSRVDSVRFVLRVVDELNGAYWRRRQYRQVGEPDLRPKGHWNSDREFHLVMMDKLV